MTCIQAIRGRAPIDLLFLSSLAMLDASVAAATDFKLSDLAGMSIDARFVRSENSEILNTTPHKFISYNNDFHEQIYISKTDEIFDRQTVSDAALQFKAEHVHANNNDELRFEENVGFTRINYDAPRGKMSTFVVVTTITIARENANYQCHIDMKYLLESGQTQYVKPIFNGDMFLKHSYRVGNTRCTVLNRNIFLQDMN